MTDAHDDRTTATLAAADLPDGDYAIVELLGHRTVVGRVQEIERFGSKMLQIEPLFNGHLLDPVLHHGAAIYAFTACTKEVAQRRGPTHEWSLPPATRACLLPDALPAPGDGDADDEIPF